MTEQIAAVTLAPESLEARYRRVTIDGFRALQNRADFGAPLVQSHSGVLVTTNGTFFLWQLENDKLRIFSLSEPGKSASNFTFTVAAPLSTLRPLDAPPTAAAISNAVKHIKWVVSKTTDPFSVKLDARSLQKAIEDSSGHGM